LAVADWEGGLNESIQDGAHGFLDRRLLAFAAQALSHCTSTMIDLVVASTKIRYYDHYYDDLFPARFGNDLDFGPRRRVCTSEIDQTIE
jgi:hypothetical protein